MAETTNAVSSPAEVEDVFRGEQVSFDEYSRYRKEGELPERFKKAEPAESAPDDAPKKTADDPEGEEPESDPDSEPEEAQEQPQKLSPAEKRIKQLLAERKDLQRKLAEKQDAKPESSTAKPQAQPQNFKEWFSAFDADKWVKEFIEANPNVSYERANASMAVYVSDAKDHFRTIEQKQEAQAKAIREIEEAARAKYEDFDEIKSNFLGKVISRDSQGKPVPLIPAKVLELLEDSEVVADLIYTIGSDEAEAAKFVEMAKSNPNQAVRYIARVESLIAEELSKPKDEPKRDEDGKFKAPEKRQTAAPKPPSPVGGASSRAFDVSDESLSPEEWARKRTADIARRRQG